MYFVPTNCYCRDTVEIKSKEDHQPKETQFNEESQILNEIKQLEEGTLTVDSFIHHIDQHKDGEVLSQIELISRALLKQLKMLTPTETVFSNLPAPLLALFELSDDHNTRFLVALCHTLNEKNPEFLIQSADLVPELAIRWLTFLAPSFSWIVRVSRKSNRELNYLMLRIDSELIAHNTELFQSIVDELIKDTISQQQKEFLFKLLTRSFVKHLIKLVSDKLEDVCSRLPISTDLEFSVSFLTTLQRQIDSVEIAKDLAKKLEQVYLRDKEREPDNLLERGLKLFFNKTLKPVVELIPLISFEKWKDSLIKALSSLNDEDLLRGIFENIHLCIRDLTGLDELFRARLSLIESITSQPLSEQELLDGSGVLRRVSNGLLIMIPPVSKDYCQKRHHKLRLPSSTDVNQGKTIMFEFTILSILTL